MSSLRNSRGDVLTYLMNTPCRVTLSTAAVIEGAVHRDYIVVHDAPPKALSEIVDLFVMVSITPKGLLIPVEKPSE